jgi:hypothetical protein
VSEHNSASVHNRPLINIILVFTLKLYSSLFFMSHRQKTSKNFEDNQTMEALEKETHFCTFSPPRQFCIRVDRIRKKINIKSFETNIHNDLSSYITAARQEPLTLEVLVRGHISH